MPLVALAVLGLVVLLAVLLMPVSLFMRYRMGTARRPARRWVAVVNVVLLMLSVAMLLFGATVTTYWVPDALRYTVLGLLVGFVLGFVGLWVSRWEASPSALHYTPSRLIVLFVTLVVTARILYGIWRSWHAWSSTGENWIVAFGPATSLAAGALVLGYYLAFWFGVWRRLRRHEAAVR